MLALRLVAQWRSSDEEWPEQSGGAYPGRPTSVGAACAPMGSALVVDDVGERVDEEQFGTTEFLREHFYVDPELAFLNHGSFGATPRVVLEQQMKWMVQGERELVTLFDREQPRALCDALTELGAFLSCDPTCLAFEDNATTACNAVLRSLALQPGDEVMCLDVVYGAVRQSIVHVCERAGARVVEVPLGFPIDADDLVRRTLAAVTERTRFALLDHIVSSTATVVPVERLIKPLQERGVLVMIDGAHAAGQLPLALDELGADFYTANCHKWMFAAKGCAFLHRRAALAEATPLLPSLVPTTVSHGNGSHFAEEFAWQGTKDYTKFLSVRPALAFIERLGGMATVRAHCNALAGRAGEQLTAAWGTRLFNPADMTAHMVTVFTPLARWAPTTWSSVALRELLLSKYRIEVPVMPLQGRLCVRVSCQVYTRAEDIDRLRDAILAIADDASQPPAEYHTK